MPEISQNPRPESTEGTSSPSSPRTAMVNLPFVTAQFRKPELDFGSAMRTVRSSLPTPQRAVYYGGLVALAAFSVIEWPVAAVIGIGTEIARRGVIDPDPGQQRPAAIEA
jgi:hypothetical protein